MLLTEYDIYARMNMKYIPDFISMICNNCYYQGQPKSITKGSILIEILLWILFFPIGIIYSVWRLSSRYSGCPQCGASEMMPANSPKAISILKQLANNNE
jgi:hypothetical protein